VSARRSRHAWLSPLLLVVGGAFALRLAYALLLAPDLQGLGDDAFYRLASLQLADGLGYVGGLDVFISGEQLPTAAHPPLYPLALSGVARLGARDVDAQRLIGVAAGTVTVLLVGLIARRLGGARAGIVAAGLCAVYPAFIAADGALMSESLFGALVAGAVLQVLRLLDRPSLLGSGLLGLTIGAAALTRSEGLLLVALLAVPVGIAARGRRPVTLAVLVAAAVLAVTPWVLRNWREFDQPIFTTNEGTTIAGANCEPTYFGAAIGGFVTSCLDEVETGENEAETSNLRRAHGLRFVRDHPRRAVVVAAVRVLRIWGAYDPLDQTNLDGRQRDVQAVGLYAFWPLVAGGVAGAVALWRRRERLALTVLLAPPVVATLTAIATYGLVRLRHIAEVSLLVLAGLALSRLRRGLLPAGLVTGGRGFRAAGASPRRGRRRRHA
jgi:4-amino-4-deoxy-L-arabinose transferase-like glycosyltransferase